MKLTFASIALVLLLFNPVSADDSLAKQLVGKWGITKIINGKESDHKSSIELRTDGTYRWENIGPAKEGKYTLKGNDLHLHFNAKISIIWKGLTIKDGQVHRKQSDFLKEVWTRAKE